MPFGNELNDFADSFTRTLGIISQFPTKEEKAQQRAQTRETEARAGALEYENTQEMRDLRRRAAEGDVAAANALAGLHREQTRAAEYENLPEQRGRRARAGEAEIAGQEALTEGTRATTGKTRAETEAQEIKNEIERGRRQKARETFHRFFGGDLEPAPPIPEDGAIPETPRSLPPPSAEDQDIIDQMAREAPPGEAAPEPEGAGGGGPQTQAIPEGEATIQQAALRTPSPAGEVGGNVIQAQAGTRRLPLNDQTLQMLQDAGLASGLDVRVTSGAQPSSGKNRTGSHRHDVNVGAADIKLIDPKTGKTISMATPEGKEQMANFVRAARAAGATGIGAGHGYMGDETLHVGFGSEAVWGAGGRGANAEDWLRDAFNNPEGARQPARAAAREPEGGISVEGGINKQEVVTSGATAAREALKGIYRVGLATGQLTGGAGGGAPGVAGAIPTQQRQQQMRGVLSGVGRADPEALANAHQAVQQALPKGVSLSEAERNLATLGFAYEWALNVDEDPQKAQLYASQILQSYRAKSNEYMAFAQHLAQGGRLDDAAKAAAKAYAYIPNGQEAKFTKDDNGNFVVTTTNMATGEEISRILVPPDQMFAKIMQWSPVDFERQMAHAAGVAMPSRAYEQAAGQLAGGIPTTTFESNVPQPTPATPMANVAGMSTEEATRIESLTESRNKAIAEQNAALAPPKPESRDAMNTELEKLVDPEFVPTEMYDTLTQHFGNNLTDTVGKILQYNPTEVGEAIAQSLTNALTADAVLPNGQSYEILPGDYQGTKKIRLVDGAEYNVPANTAVRIKNALDDASAVKRGEVSARTTKAIDRFEESVRNRMDLQRKLNAAQGAPLVPQPGPYRGMPAPPLTTPSPTQPRSRFGAIPIR